MAINFLQNVSLNNTELQNFKVQNVTSDPSVTGEGQLIYRSDSNVLKFYNGASWITLDSNAGTVTSVGVSSNYLTIGSSPITSSGTISVNMPNSGVTAASYTHASITVNAQGIVTAASNGTATLGVTSFTNANGTFISAGTANSAATGAVTMGTIDLSASGTPGATTFLRGDNVWATPAGAYTSWSLEGDSGSAVDITDGLRVDFTGGTGISTTVASATPNTLTITNTGVTSAVAGSNISVSSGTGAVTIAYTGGTGAMDSFTIQGDSGSSSVSNGQTLDIAGGTGLTSAESSRTVTLNLDDTAVSPGSYTLASITVDQQGRITSASSGSSGSMSSWKIGSTSGTDQSVTNGQTVDVVGGTYITGSVGGTRTVTLTHDTTSRTNNTSSSSPGSAGTFTAIDSVTTNTTGHITAVNTKTVTMPTVPSAYSGWTLAGDSGSSQTISSGNTATFTGGTGISTEAGTSTDEITLTNTGVTSNVAGAGIGVSGATGAVTITNTGVTSAVAGSNISVSSGTGAVTIAYTGGTGEMTSWTLAADSGSSQSITDGNTVTIQGSTGIDTAVSATDDVTINLDLNELTTITSAAATDELIINSSGNKKIDIDDIHLNQFGDAESTIDMGGFKILDVGTGTSGTDAVNVNQLNAAVVGLLDFKGGFNANTGAIVGGGNLTSGASRVAVDVGDFYVVTVAGNFFGDTSEPLEIGDQVICQTAAVQGASVIGDFVTVQANIDIATTSTVGLVSVPSAGGIDVSGAGAISLDSQSSSGSYGAVTKTLTATVDGKGIVTAMADANIAIPASQITDFCAAVTTCIGNNHNAVANIGNGSATSYEVSHSLGTRDVMVQVYRNESPYDTIHVGVERTSTSIVTLSTVAALATNEARVLITEIL